jgi:nicotinamidase/pyrazinamidase
MESRMKVTLTSRDALIVGDIQNDFMPGGALPVSGGTEIISSLNRYIDSFSHTGLPVFFTRDWHPPDHLSFRDGGGVWPPHCVEGSRGAMFHEELKMPRDNRIIISKGTSREFDAYSSFQGTMLHSLLEERGIRRVFVGGVATDYCIKNTVLGALNLGYMAFVLIDACRGVDVKKGDSEQALALMLSSGAVAIGGEDIGQIHP